MERLDNAGKEEGDAVEGADDLDCTIEDISTKHIYSVKGLAYTQRYTHKG